MLSSKTDISDSQHLPVGSDQFFCHLPETVPRRRRSKAGGYFHRALCALIVNAVCGQCCGTEPFVLLQVPVKTQRRDDDDDEEEEAVICEACGRSDRRHQLLVCVHCDSGYGFTVLWSFHQVV